LISTARAVLGAAILIVASAAVTATVMSKWNNLFPPTDYEDWAAHAAKTAKSKEALSVLISVCESEFRGRQRMAAGMSTIRVVQVADLILAAHSTSREQTRPQTSRDTWRANVRPQ
jgi:hypothetical protein